MRSALYCVIVTLSVAAAACGGNGDPADAGPPADAPIAADGSSITPDAAIDAAAPDAAGPDSGFALGVPCGESGDVCAPPESAGCCTGKGGTSCLPAGKSTCFGRLSACDGPEDCTSAEVCCSVQGNGPACAAADACDLQDGNLVQCHVESDCPVAGDHCCGGQCLAGCD